MGKMKQRKNIIRVIYKEYTMLLTLIVLFAIAAIVAPAFTSIQNLMNIFRQSAVVGCVALGVSLVIFGGTFDMSVGATVSLTGMLALILQNQYGVAGAMLIALAAGGLIGLVNGLLITAINGGAGDSFMITFGMMSLVQAIALIITNGKLTGGSDSAFYRFIGNGDIGVIPFSIILFFILAIIMQIFVTKTKAGRDIYYMGANREAARLAGVNVRRVKTFTYFLAGIMSAVGAFVLTARSNGALPKSGEGMEFDVVTAIVVGGVGINGGEGSILHTVIGVLIMGVISNAMNIIGISSQNQLVVKGVILVLAVCLDNVKKKRKA